MARRRGKKGGAYSHKVASRKGMDIKTQVMGRAAVKKRHRGVI